MELTFRSRRYISTIVTEVTQLCVLTTTLYYRNHRCAIIIAPSWRAWATALACTSSWFPLDEERRKKIFQTTEKRLQRSSFPVRLRFPIVCPDGTRRIYRDSQGMKSQAAASSYIFSLYAVGSFGSTGSQGSSQFGRRSSGVTIELFFLFCTSPDLFFIQSRKKKKVKSFFFVEKENEYNRQTWMIYKRHAMCNIGAGQVHSTEDRSNYLCCVYYTYVDIPIAPLGNPNV